MLYHNISGEPSIGPFESVVKLWRDIMDIIIKDIEDLAAYIIKESIVIVYNDAKQFDEDNRPCTIESIFGSGCEQYDETLLETNLNIFFFRLYCVLMDIGVIYNITFLISIKCLLIL